MRIRWGHSRYWRRLRAISRFARRMWRCGRRWGNGLDFKFGVFDSIIGYESVESPANPNFTRSYGHSIEPQTHTGLLASYRFSDCFSFTAGVANTVNSSINSRAQAGRSARPAGFSRRCFRA
jgi:hypothetical protein